MFLTPAACFGLIFVYLKPIISNEETASKQCLHFRLTLYFDPFHINKKQKDVPTPDHLVI